MPTTMPDELADHLSAIIELPEQTREIIAKQIAESSTLQLMRDDHIKEIAKKAGTEASIIENGFSAMVALYAYTSKEEDGDLDKVVAALAHDKIKTEERRATILALVRRLEPQIVQLLEDIGSLGPVFPLDKYLRITTRVVSLSEFDKEFRLREPIEKYEPALTRNRPRISITLMTESPHNDDRRYFTFVATEFEVDGIINVLRLAKKQLAAVERAAADRSS